MIEPKISVRLMTYNHSDFIDQAMEGIFLQKTSFPFEIVIGDDFSDDNTLEKIYKYKSTEKIKIHILRRKYGGDYWLKRQKIGRLYNFTNIIENCKGKYIALLDGDDYWTDPFKLQKQVDFLEEHSQFSACFTNAVVLDELHHKTYTYQKYKKEEYDVEDIIRGSGSLFPTASLVFRNKIRKFPLFFCKAKSGDRALALLLANLGKFYLINEKTCVYRRHNNGIFSSILKNQTERIKIDESNIQLLNDYNDFTNKKYDKQVNKAVSKRSLISLLRDRNKIFSKEKFRLLRNLTITDGLRLLKNLSLNNKLKE